MKDKVKSIWPFLKKESDKEYSKRLLSKITNHTLLMMWGTYVLAWFDKIEIAETLSKTIATSIIAVVVGYLAKSVIENISKNTDAFGKNKSDNPEEKIAKKEAAPVNKRRDC